MQNSSSWALQQFLGGCRNGKNLGYGVESAAAAADWGAQLYHWLDHVPEYGWMVTTELVCFNLMQRVVVSIHYLTLGSGVARVS